MKKYLLPTLLTALLVTGCGSLPSFNSSPDYQSAQTGKDLEVPPDLTRPEVSDRYSVPGAGSATYSDYKKEATPQQEHEQQVLPQVKVAHIERDGAKRWLVVNESAEDTWTRVKDFLKNSGLTIKVEDPKVGFIETDWLEKHTEAPETGIRRLLQSVMKSTYSNGERDKYRFRLERSADGKSTEIFVTHLGLEEVLKSRDGASDTGQTVWQMRPSDPTLEGEMLGKLMVSFGASADEAKGALAAGDTQKPKAVLAGSAILLDEPFDHAWHRVGIALDHSNFIIEDRDRSQGVYFVRYTLPEEKQEEGFISSLAFWKSKSSPKAESYRVVVKPQATGSLVSVLDRDGNQVASEAVARILHVLVEQLN